MLFRCMPSFCPATPADASRSASTVSQSCDRRVQRDSHALWFTYRDSIAGQLLSTLRPPTPMAPSFANKLSKKRDKYREQLATALTEDPDPLAVYDSFIKWTVESYGSHLAQSGLIELLDEATRHFVDDDVYKNDLRYLKLWLLYASHVEDPTMIYQFLIQKNIGRNYAQTYQELADALERQGR